MKEEDQNSLPTVNTLEEEEEIKDEETGSIKLIVEEEEALKEKAITKKARVRKSLEKIHAHKQQKTKVLEAQLEEAKANIQELENQLEASQELDDTKDAIIQDLENQLEASQELDDTKDAIIQDLENQLEASQELDDTNDAIIQELENRLEESKFEVKFLEVAMESFQIVKDSEVGQLQAENEKLQEDLDTRNFQMGELEKSRINLKNQVEELLSTIEIKELSYLELELQLLCDKFKSLNLKLEDSEVSQLHDEVSCKGKAENLCDCNTEGNNPTNEVNNLSRRVHFREPLCDENRDLNEHRNSPVQNIQEEQLHEKGSELTNQNLELMHDLASPTVTTDGSARPKEIRITGTKANGAFPIGTPVLKQFEKNKWYFGMIIKHDPETKCFKVVFSNNDEEELDFEEVNEHLYVKKIKTINKSVPEFKEQLDNLVKLGSEVSGEDVTNILGDFLNLPQIVQYTIMLKLAEKDSSIEESWQVFIQMVQLPMMESQKYPIGTPVLKQFGDDTKWYFGMITEYDKECNFFKVTYEDNDKEELEFGEVNEHLYVNKMKTLVPEFKEQLDKLVKLVESKGDVGGKDITSILVALLDFPQIVQYTILSELDEEVYPVERSREVIIKMLQLPMMKPPKQLSSKRIISILLRSFILFSHTEQEEIIEEMEKDEIFCFLEHRTCNIKQCFKKIEKYGLCCDHQDNSRKSKQPRCSYPGCISLVTRYGFCDQHLQQKDHLKAKRGNFDDINSIIQLYPDTIKK